MLTPSKIAVTPKAISMLSTEYSFPTQQREGNVPMLILMQACRRMIGMADLTTLEAITGTDKIYIYILRFNKSSLIWKY